MGAFLIAWLVFAPLVFALPVYFLERRKEQLVRQLMMALCVLELAGAVGLFFLPESELLIPGFCGLGAHFAPSFFGKLMTLITAVAWLLSCVSAPGMLEGYVTRYRLFTLLTLGGTVGVFLCGDLFTAYVFFEIMSTSSVIWVALKGEDVTLKAARQYLAIGVLGGLVMLMGLFLLYSCAGTLRFDELRIACEAVENRVWLYGAAGCLLFGFGAKAGMFPLHTWLPKAYPAAPASATALLSSVLSKAGVFGILVIGTGIFYEDPVWGNLLLVLALMTMVLGALIALFSDDFKRTLAGSSMSQIGFVLVGVAMMSLLGEERALAAGGSVLHMVNHSLFKLILFLVAGGILSGCGSLKLNDLMGYGRKKPYLLAVFLMPALGLGGVPLFSGYVSKTLLHESIVEYRVLLLEHGMSAGWYTAAEWVFLLTGGLTLAYMAKLFTVLFLERGIGENKPFLLPMSVKVWLGILAVCVPLFGVLAQITYFPLAQSSLAFLEAGELHHIHLFSWENLKGAVISLLAGALFYFGLVRTLLIRREETGGRICPDVWPSWLSLDRLFYHPLLKLLEFLGAFGARVAASLGGWGCWLAAKLIGRKGKVVPRTEDNFGIYTGRDYRHNILTDTLAYELLLCGLGVVAALIYLLLA